MHVDSLALAGLTLTLTQLVGSNVQESTFTRVNELGMYEIE
jgi:hypothetical protein